MRPRETDKKQTNINGLESLGTQVSALSKEHKLTTNKPHYLKNTN